MLCRVPQHPWGPRVCSSLSHGGCSSVVSPLPQACCWVPHGTGPLSLTPVLKLRDLLSPTVPTAHICQEPRWLQWEQCNVSALEWGCGDSGDTGGDTETMQGLPQGSCTVMGLSHTLQVGLRCQDPVPGLCPTLERVGVLGRHLQTQNWFGPPELGTPGPAPCLGLPFCRKGVCSGMRSSTSSPHSCIPASWHQGDSLPNEPPAPASSSSIQPERIKEGSEQINKHMRKTQTNPGAANEANSLDANHCLASTPPRHGEDTTCQQQLPSARRVLPAPASPWGFRVSR